MYTTLRGDKLFDVGEMKVKANGGWEWLWNAIDRGTRFLLSSRLSKGKEVKDARAVSKECKERAKRKPKVIITDSLQSYHKAF